jgi:DNA-binding LacI/PurR family transcriptional regulator
MWSDKDFYKNENLLSMGMVQGVVSYQGWAVDTHEEILKLATRYCSNLAVCHEYYPKYDCVNFDNVQIGRNAGWMLFQNKQHSKILIICSQDCWPGYLEREQGIRESAISMKVPQSRTHWLTLKQDHEQLGEQLTARMQAGLTFDTIFVHIPMRVKIITEICKKLKHPIPYIVSVGTKEQLMEKRIAGVVPDADAMGKEAADLLLKRMDDPFRPVEHRTVSSVNYWNK